MPIHLFSKQKIHANRKVCMDSTFSIGGDKRDRTADLLNAIFFKGNILKDLKFRKAFILGLLWHFSFLPDLYFY